MNTLESTQCKFRVTEITKFIGSIQRKNAEGRWDYRQGECERIKLGLVNSSTPENDAFTMYSPYVNAELVITNENVFGFFKLDGEYYFDIRPAEKK